MRGLTDGRKPGVPRGTSGEPRRTTQAASAAVAVFVALGVSLSGCGTGGTGARDEGPAHADTTGVPASLAG